MRLPCPASPLLTNWLFEIVGVLNQAKSPWDVTFVITLFVIVTVDWLRSNPTLTAPPPSIVKPSIAPDSTFAIVIIASPPLVVIIVASAPSPCRVTPSLNWIGPSTLGGVNPRLNGGLIRRNMDNVRDPRWQRCRPCAFKRPDVHTIAE